MSIFHERREFLTGAAAGVLALTGCGGPAADGKGKPRRGGQFRALFTGGGEQETVDPHAEALAIGTTRTKALFDRLVDLDATMAPVPRLARKRVSHAHATAGRFTLREALSHDGKPLAPEDVVFAFGRVLTPKAATHFAQSLLSVMDLKKSRSAGKNVAEVALKQPGAEFPAPLGTLGTAFVGSRYADPAKPVGTGASTLRSFRAGRAFVAERFGHHGDGGAYVDELRSPSAGVDARGNAPRAGRAEFGYTMAPAPTRTVQADKSVRTLAAKGATALGPAATEAVLTELARHRQEHSTALLWVSHDPGLLAAVAHHIIVIDGGHTVGTGTPDQVGRALRTNLTRRLVRAMDLGTALVATDLVPAAPGS
ncbi:ABC transporter substrate-binding protein [Streptomyces sp. NPDC003016]